MMGEKSTMMRPWYENTDVPRLLSSGPMQKGYAEMRDYFLFPFIILAATAFAACDSRSSAPIGSEPAASVGQVPGCVSTGLYKTAASDTDFTYEFTDSKLVIDFLLPDNCTADSVRFATSFKITGDTIFIASVDTATANARCPCTYLIHSEFEGLWLDRYYVICTRFDDGVETVPYSRYVYRDNARGTSEEVVYTNGFESASDTAGWVGYGSMQLRSDVPPGGGKYSLFVSGGCAIPHAALKIVRVDRDSRFILRFWGKKLIGGGGVGIGFNQSPIGGIGVSVNDSTWTHYQSKDILYCPADSSLWLTLISGGIVPGAMLVDNIQVVKVK